MITDLDTARRWLEGTFLRVRLQDNPSHYSLPGDAPDRSLTKRLENICVNAILQLEKNMLVSRDPLLKSTEYGEAMARYYMNVETMKLLMELQYKPKISELVISFEVRSAIGS